MALEHYTEKILLTTKDSFCKAKLMAKEKLNMLMEKNMKDSGKMINLMARE